MCQSVADRNIIKRGEHMDYLMLVSRFEPIPEGFDKKLILKRVSGKLFESQAANALSDMLEAARKDSIVIEVVSGYRSADYQQLLWEKEISKEMAGGLGYTEAVEKVSQTLALPHCSEHETGLAADLAEQGNDDVDYSFSKSPQAKWLEKNAYRYGFILRYPRLKEHITGIAFEPWHYRYVGTESAELIRSSGLCLEEFLDFYQDKYMDIIR